MFFDIETTASELKLVLMYFLTAPIDDGSSKFFPASISLIKSINDHQFNSYNNSMPELPEVETIKLGLTKLITGKKILKIDVLNLKSFPNNKADVDNFILGKEIINIRRRAKLLMIDLSSNYSLLIHLKMTGQLVYVSDDTRFGAGHPNDSLINDLPDRSTRVIFELSRAKLFFNDQRKFGWIKVIPTELLSDQEYFSKHGPEPLADISPAVFKSNLKKHPRSNIKASLLDQSVIAGIGNIYADESLFLSKIHPKTLVKDLSNQKINSLINSIRQVLELSISKGGSTDRNYVNAEGKKGSYLEFANVFRRENQSCPVCHSTIIKIRVAGRGTHLCPNCQKATMVE